MLLVLPLIFSSCEKSNYCAQCIEYNSGYIADEFCGSSDQVDIYIQTLYGYNITEGASWSCIKVAD